MGVKPYVTASKLIESKSDFLDILKEILNLIQYKALM